MLSQRGSGSSLIGNRADQETATVSTFESIVKKLKKLTIWVETSVSPASWSRTDSW